MTFRTLRSPPSPRTTFRRDGAGARGDVRLRPAELQLARRVRTSAVVDVDTETGEVDLRQYIAVDEVGNVINPMVVDGQVQGGVAQGIAQALFEEAIYDEDGNLTTGSMVNYLVPSAAETIDFDTRPRRERRARRTRWASRAWGRQARSPPRRPSSTRSSTRSRRTASPTSTKPAKPERVWRAIQDAKGGAT